MGTRKQYLKPQNKAQKKCPLCKENTVYTGSYAQHNPKIDGKDVCEDCYVTELTARILERRRREENS